MEQGHGLTLISEGVIEAQRAALEWPVRRSHGGKAVWPSGDRTRGHRRRAALRLEGEVKGAHRTSSSAVGACQINVRTREPLGWAVAAAAAFAGTVGAACIFAIVGWLSS